MAKDPAFLFYSSDFLTGVMFMSMEERGQYITMLCILHQHGGALDLKSLEFVVGKVSDKVLSKFKRSKEGKLYNARLSEESKKRKAFCDSRRKNIQKRYKKPTSVDASVKHMDQHMENANANTNAKEDKNVKSNTKSINSKSNIIKKKQYAENVKMEEAEYNKLLKRHSKYHVEKAIQVLDNYKGAKGKKYKSDYRAILSWVMDKVKKEYGKSQYADAEREVKINREGIKQLQNLTKRIGEQ